MRTSRPPKVWIAASTAYFAWASFVTSSGTVRTVSPNLPARWTRCCELRAEASTRCPALRASSVKARPRPREAPVISQTFDMPTSSAPLLDVRERPSNQNPLPKHREPEQYSERDALRSAGKEVDPRRSQIIGPARDVVQVPRLLNLGHQARLSLPDG